MLVRVAHLDVNSSKLDLKQTMNEFSDVFESLGCVAEKHQITVDETIQPVVHQEQELERMQGLGVIKKTEEPTM